MKRSFKLWLGAVVTVSAVVAIPAVVVASGGDGGTLTVWGKSTAKNTTNVTFQIISSTTNGPVPAGALVGLQDTCTKSSTLFNLNPGAGGSLQYEGNANTLLPTPLFSGCTDNAGAPTNNYVDLIKTNHVVGNWTATYNDAADGGGEVLGNNGDNIDIQSPQAGLTVNAATVANGGNPATQGCVIVANPNGTDSPANATYNDLTGTATFTNQLLTYKINQIAHKPTCPFQTIHGNARFNGTYVTTPHLSDS